MEAHELLTIDEWLNNKEMFLHFATKEIVDKLTVKLHKKHLKWFRGESPVTLEKDLIKDIDRYFYIKTENGYIERWVQQNPGIETREALYSQHPCYTVIAVIYNTLILRYDSGPELYIRQYNERIARYEDTHSLEQRIRLLEEIIRKNVPEYCDCMKELNGRFVSLPQKSCTEIKKEN